jgi:hypothetical protein
VSGESRGGLKGMTHAAWYVLPSMKRELMCSSFIVLVFGTYTQYVQTVLSSITHNVRYNIPAESL